MTYVQVAFQDLFSRLLSFSFLTSNVTSDHVKDSYNLDDIQTALWAILMISVKDIIHEPGRFLNSKNFPYYTINCFVTPSSA